MGSADPVPPYHIIPTFTLDCDCTTVQALTDHFLVCSDIKKYELLLTIATMHYNT